MTTTLDPALVKRCCAAAYEHQIVGWLLGESYHPGGLALTDRLAELMRIVPGQTVIDVASGPGTSALHLARSFGVQVRGVDLSPGLVARANLGAEGAGLGQLASFHVGDAETLSFRDDVADALLCECAMCIFPDKTVAVAEFARVVRPGGSVGISDVVVDQTRLPAELATLAGRIACVANATTLEDNLALLEGAGMQIQAAERHDGALEEMLRRVGLKLDAAAMALQGDLGLQLRRARELLSLALVAAREGVVGYALVHATIP